MLGLEPATEKSNSRSKADDGEQLALSKDSKESSEKDHHGKRGAKDFPDAKIIHNCHDMHQKADSCPKCPLGKLYKYEPSVLVRISGHSPYEATICNAHARRSFHELEKNDPKVIGKILNDCQQIFYNEGQCKQNSLNPSERLSFHVENSLPLMEKILGLIDLGSVYAMLP